MEVVGRLDKRLVLITKKFYERFAQERRPQDVLGLMSEHADDGAAVMVGGETDG